MEDWGKSWVGPIDTKSAERLQCAGADLSLLERAIQRIRWERDFNERRWQDCAARYADLQKQFHELMVTKAANLRQEQAAAVAVMLVRFNRDVYLARRAPNTKVYPDAWECPTGKVESDERVRFAALCTLEMEAPGIQYADNQLQSIGVLHLSDNAPLGRVNVHLFCVELQDSDPSPGHGEPMKRGAWQRFSAAELVEHIKSLGPEQNKITPATRTLLSAIWADNNLW